MLLAALTAYAEARGLLAQGRFATRRVHFVLCLSPEGRLLAVQPTGPDGVEMCVPRPPLRSVNIAAGFMVDNSKYVLGYTGERKRRTERAAECVAAFAALAREAAEATGSVEATAVMRFLADAPARERVLTEREWTGAETLAFAVEGVGGLAHDVPALRAWWERRGAQEDAGGVVGLCSVTGEVGPLVRV
ncbi:type I-C CRISPR-associated protein Cas8c/Csd1, partial [Myxococcus llanfairpwllgwyngyllgogerychwyrndrobwllllantysiliogogogochensis]